MFTLAAVGAGAAAGARGWRRRLRTVGHQRQPGERAIALRNTGPKIITHRIRLGEQLVISPELW